MMKYFVLLLAISSESLAKLYFSPDHVLANMHEIHTVLLASDRPLPKNTVIEIFPLPNEKAAEMSPREIVVEDETTTEWNVEITVKAYGVTSFIANVKGNQEPEESGGVQVQVTHLY